jgi:hypothetical protein
MFVAVAHASWAPERKRGLARIKEVTDGRFALFESKIREHASTWALRIWQWAAERNAPTIVLNDDVIPHPDLVKVVEAMIEAVGPRVLSLHPNNPAAVSLHRDGHRWMRSYVLTGPAYVLTPEAAASLIAWYDAAPRNFTSKINEDNYGIHWSWDRQEPIWQSTMALVEHDTTIPSTLGYDDHPNRKAYVHWGTEDLTDPEYWRVQDEPPWVANTWAHPAYMASIRRMIRAKMRICDFCLEEPGNAVHNVNVGVGINCLRQIRKASDGKL